MLGHIKLYQEAYLHQSRSILTSRQGCDQVLVLMSKRFIPEPSAKSIGAYEPKNKEHAKLLTNEIL